MARIAAFRCMQAALLLALAGALAGCGVSTLTSSFSGGIFGGGKAEQDAPKPAEAAAVNTAQANAAPAPAAPADGGADCPTVSVGPGEGNVTFMAKGGNNDSLSVMHRGEITDTARECSASISGGLAVKVGFAGRVLLGPQGKPGTVTLPVKITLIDANRATVKADQVKVPVTVLPNQPSAKFSIVREVVLQVPPGTSPRSYRIVIAFDRRAPGAS